MRFMSFLYLGRKETCTPEATNRRAKAVYLKNEASIYSAAQGILLFHVHIAEGSWKETGTMQVALWILFAILCGTQGTVATSHCGH